jgi:Phosphotransferase enzyme family
VSADSSSVLVDADGAVPRLWSLDAHPADVVDIVAGLRAQLGQSVSVLRCVRSEPQPDGDTVHLLWEVELLDARLCPRGWHWVDRVRAEAEPIDGREWQRPGWWREAHDWIRSQLPRVDGIEQIRCWEFSYVARVRASTGVHYFKALPESYAHEPPLTEALAAQHPRLLPSVLAVHSEKRWVLTRAAPGTCLEWKIALEPWLRSVSAYAELQRAWSTRTAELRALGCTDTWPPLDTVWAAEAWRRLNAYDIPNTIDHGDFWPSNVFVTRTRSRIIDWTDASIAHPFFSLLPMRLAFGFDRRRSGLEHLRTAYLEPWGGVTTLGPAFDLAQPLAALHYAAKLEHLPPHGQWWLHRFVPWLQQIAQDEAARLVW